jgi:uncharacterized protein GlcG (DUF336 family)
MPEMTARLAQKAIELAVAKAKAIDLAISVAVVDSGRNLVGFMRMDGALLGTIQVAQGKAYTARTVNMETDVLGPLVQAGGPLYGMDSAHNPPLIVFGGGIPIKADDTIVGAVGISGGTVEQDIEVAKAVVAGLDR